jgi:hypothetical protein
MTVVPGVKSPQEKVQVCVRQMTLDDIPAVLDLQRRAFAGGDHFRQRRRG